MKNVGGIEYENLIINSIVTANSLLANVENNSLNAGFDSTKPDLTLQLKNDKVHIEIKSSPKDQMGGTSLTYSLDKGFEINSLENFNDDLQKIILKSIKEKETSIKSLLNYWNINSIPSPITKEDYTKAVKKELIKPINTKIETDITSIHNHYRKKDCYYIQIGKSGFFYLHENPLNLPIPQLNGDINLEIRVTRNGSKISKKTGISMVSTLLRIQGRLKMKINSPYTLENPEHIKHLFNKINN
jgi:hypothetical protein